MDNEIQIENWKLKIENYLDCQFCTVKQPPSYRRSPTVDAGTLIIQRINTQGRDFQWAASSDEEAVAERLKERKAEGLYELS